MQIILISFSGDQWVARAHLKVSNIFGIRPTGTEFFVGSSLTQFTNEDWGDDTIGQLIENDRPGRNPVALGWAEESEKLMRSLDLKMEVRFPTNRFLGSCVLSRLGHRL